MKLGHVLPHNIIIENLGLNQGTIVNFIINNDDKVMTQVRLIVNDIGNTEKVYRPEDGYFLYRLPDTDHYSIDARAWPAVFESEKLGDLTWELRTLDMESLNGKHPAQFRPW